MTNPDFQSTYALIHIPSFRQNVATLRRYIDHGVKIMAIVKADAYGHGGLRISREAIQCGAEYLGVARVQEALELREQGISHPMLVFEIPPPTTVANAIGRDIELTVASLESAEHAAREAARLQHKAHVHIKIDTGMGRLGIWHQSAADLITKVAGMKWIELVGVYSHFASSDEADLTFAKEQLRSFESVIEEIERRKIWIPFKHIANSAAIMQLPASHLTMVRPGIMLYGYSPARWMEPRTPLKPVMSLQSRVGFIKEVPPNTSISYSRRYYTTDKTRIATIPVGYADGYSRLLTNKAEVLINGKRYPCVGTVCMDQIMVDIGLTDDIGVGDNVTLIGAQEQETISAWDIAERIGTIPYEVTSLISPRVPRIFVD
jgi:alanine racemase